MKRRHPLFSFTPTMTAVLRSAVSRFTQNSKRIRSQPNFTSTRREVTVTAFDLSRIPSFTHGETGRSIGWVVANLHSRRRISSSSGPHDTRVKSGVKCLDVSLPLSHTSRVAHGNRMPFKFLLLIVTLVELLAGGTSVHAQRGFLPGSKSS